jgi:cobalt/nickel transport system permease protein
VSFHHLDQFASVSSPVTRIPAVGRLIGAVVFAVVAATLPAGAWIELLVLAAVAVTLLAIARIPPGTALARLAWPLGAVVIASVALLVMVPGEPLVRIGFVPVSRIGAERFAVTICRAAVALVPAVLLVSTTTFPELLHALRQLRLPRPVAIALGLGYRLLYLTLDEIERIQRAARSRNAGHGAARRRRLLIAAAAATLARAFGRGERTHRAMLARGFSGDLPLLAETAWTSSAVWRLSMLSTLFIGIALIARIAR